MYLFFPGISLDNKRTKCSCTMKFNKSKNVQYSVQVPKSQELLKYGATHTPTPSLAGNTLL